MLLSRAEQVIWKSKVRTTWRYVRMFHFRFWMVSIVQAATCGWALSWRNDTDVCAPFLLFLMAGFTGPSRSAEWCSMFIVWRSVGKSTYRVPEDGGRNLPSRERGLRFFGFQRPWVMPLHWRTFALRHEVMHPRLIRRHDRIQNKSPSCLYRDNYDCATCRPVLVFIRQ